jgi:hypothetical protein
VVSVELIIAAIVPKVSKNLPDCLGFLGGLALNFVRRVL